MSSKSELGNSMAYETRTFNTAFTRESLKDALKQFNNIV